MKHKNNKCVVAMSGGVDSSTTAAILKDQGYDVIGLTLLLSKEHEEDSDFIRNVQQVTDQLGVELVVKDLRSQFHDVVINYFVETYENGLTPNPCVVCNQQIKFGEMLKEAMDVGGDFLATGHYVRLMPDDNQRIRLLKGVDPVKDQSYFLYRLNQEQLRRTLFPLGGYTKPEVRELARSFELSVAEKDESQDLCFLGNENYRDFFQRHSQKQFNPGMIKDLKGNQLGVHKGLWNYTIGQRKGLGVAAGEPVYVVDLDTESNQLIVATNKERGKDRIVANQVTYINGEVPEGPFKANIKIRYTAKEIDAEIVHIESDKVQIHLSKSLPDIAPGQSVVFYQEDELIGGGVILR